MLYHFLGLMVAHCARIVNDLNDRSLSVFPVLYLLRYARLARLLDEDKEICAELGSLEDVVEKCKNKLEYYNAMGCETGIAKALMPAWQ
jgi:hypothetical protein